VCAEFQSKPKATKNLLEFPLLDWTGGKKERRKKKEGRESREGGGRKGEGGRAGKEGRRERAREEEEKEDDAHCVFVRT